MFLSPSPRRIGLGDVAASWIQSGFTSLGVALCPGPASGLSKHSSNRLSCLLAELVKCLGSGRDSRFADSLSRRASSQPREWSEQIAGLEQPQEPGHPFPSSCTVRQGCPQGPTPGVSGFQGNLEEAVPLRD